MQMYRDFGGWKGNCFRPLVKLEAVERCICFLRKTSVFTPGGCLFLRAASFVPTFTIFIQTDDQEVSGWAKQLLLLFRLKTVVVEKLSLASAVGQQVIASIVIFLSFVESKILFSSLYTRSFVHLRLFVFPQFTSYVYVLFLSSNLKGRCCLS